MNFYKELISMHGKDKQAKEAIETLLKYLGEDLSRPGLRNTSQKTIEGYKRIFSGYGQDPDSIIGESAFDRNIDTDQIVIMREIKFHSFCEHHFLPFSGTIDIAYLPTNGVVGFGRILKIIDVFTKRLQLQENMTQDIANSLMKNLRSKGVAVSVKAKHHCLSMLEGRDPMVHTEKVLGDFNNNDILAEKFRNIANKSIKDEV